MTKPFDGAITRHFEKKAPKKVRKAVEDAKPGDILSDTYPYERRMKRKEYEEAYDALQIELAKMQLWMRETGARMVALFEGRDAAGKGGAIRRVNENLNPRYARIVALPKPTETEQGEWYFQRYIRHLPTAGELVMYDRSWYNRAVVERVFGFCTDEERERFFLQAPGFERALVGEGIKLVKFWLTVSQAEQLHRFLAREEDPLKQWKLSQIDIDSLAKWDEYTEAIEEMFGRTHHDVGHWTVIRADDKKRARIGVMQKILTEMEYEGKDPKAISAIDPLIVGDPMSIGLA